MLPTGCGCGQILFRDHRVIQDALAQIPAELIETIEILLRTDSAGATHALLDFCREHRVRATSPSRAGHDKDPPSDHKERLLRRRNRETALEATYDWSSSVTLMPSLNFTSSRTSATSSWPLKRRQRSCAAMSSL